MNKDEKIHKKYDKTAYSGKYDAFFKIETGEWVESTCDDPQCDTCEGRPNNYYDLFDAEDIPAIIANYKKSYNIN